jgi:hypothetical protein
MNISVRQEFFFLPHPLFLSFLVYTFLLVLGSVCAGCEHPAFAFLTFLTLDI